MLKELKKIMDKKTPRRMNKYQYKDIKEPNKILELKSTVADMKNSLWGFNSFRFQVGRREMSKLEENY